MTYSVTRTNVNFPQGLWSHYRAAMRFSRCHTQENFQRLMATAPTATALDTTFHYTHTVPGTPYQSFMHAPVFQGWFAQPMHWVQQHTAPIVQYVQPATRYVTERVVEPAVENVQRSCRKWVFVL